MPPTWPIPPPDNATPHANAGPNSIYRVIDRVDADARDFKTLKAAEMLADHVLQRWEQKKWALNALFHVAEYFLDWVAIKPDAEALWYQGRTWTYKQMNSMSNRIFHFMRDKMGLQRGGMAGMLLQNCPEFLFVQVGLAKLKVAEAWLNHNLRGASLLGCLDIADPSLLVFETAMGGHVLEVLDKLINRPKPVKLVLYDNEKGEAGRKVAEEIRKRGGVVEVITEQSLMGFSDAEPDPAIRREGTTKEETMCLIYTSGTTGLPKATNIPFSRGSSAHLSWICSGIFNSSDRFYQTLPLFHSSGQIGVTISWIMGIPLVVSRKFSASGFMKEATESGATLFQYIGELGRYLVTAPPGPYDRKHKIRGGLGNGMRSDIWTGFKERFGIPHLYEFYGATDGNILIFQDSGPNSPPQSVGACGFIGPLFDQMAGSYRLVKWDVDTELPYRDADGFCVPAAWGEPGEYLGRIDPVEKSKLGVDNWSGYYGNKSATDKKVLTDCFEKGDRWLRQGDLLRREYPGWIYFVDRIGDTFRWKGENVSTAEVGTMMGLHPAVEEANVFGVKLPHFADGRCGAAVVRLDPLVADLGGPKELAAMKELGKWISDQLPAYALPRFLRIQDGELEVTGTHKHRKVDLQNDGADPHKIKDRMYWLSPEDSTKAYTPYGPKEWATINAGKSKL